MTDRTGVGGGSQRERKRQQTLQRITKAGIRLFSSQGYDETTLEQIVAEAGIARRTFFHYFKSKDEILLSLQQGMGEGVVAALADQPLNGGPFAAAQAALLAVITRFSADEMLTIDRLLRSSAAVQAKKHASYKRDEEILFAGLRERWPEDNPIALRLVATMTVNVGRVAVETWIEDGGHRPLADVMTEAFRTLRTVQDAR